MLELFHSFRDINDQSVVLRLFLAFLCGGIIGAERELKRRQPGFRTHILICMGAAMATLTSQYLYFVQGYFTDIGRLGAQVVAGIGFIGAGAIVVTKHNRVKGLTTAAGLWTSAIIGLCFGAGFYEGGLIATCLLLITELGFSKIVYHVLRFVPEINLQIVYGGNQTLDSLLFLFKKLNVKVLHLEIAHRGEGEKNHSLALFNLRLNKRCNVEKLLESVGEIQGISLIKEL